MADLLKIRYSVHAPISCESSESPKGSVSLAQCSRAMPFPLVCILLIGVSCIRLPAVWYVIESVTCLAVCCWKYSLLCQFTMLMVIVFIVRYVILFRLVSLLVTLTRLNIVGWILRCWTAQNVKVHCHCAALESVGIPRCRHYQLNNESIIGY